MKKVKFSPIRENDNLDQMRLVRITPESTEDAEINKKIEEIKKINTTDKLNEKEDLRKELRELQIKKVKYVAQIVS